jgi:hypothetical protein
VGDAVWLGRRGYRFGRGTALAADLTEAARPGCSGPDAADQRADARIGMVANVRAKASNGLHTGGRQEATPLLAVQKGVVDQMKQLSAIRMVLEVLLMPRHGA